MMAAMLTLTLNSLLLVLRTHRSLMLENLALRHQLAVLQRSAPNKRQRLSERFSKSLHRAVDDDSGLGRRSYMRGDNSKLPMV